MSSPKDPNPTPDDTPGSPSKRQGAAPDDPTYTQWPPVVPPRTPPPSSTAGDQPPVSPNDPTLTQWPPATPQRGQPPVSPNDPTYTQWPPVVPPRTPPPSPAAGGQPPVSPNDPTLTQWPRATPQRGAPSGQTGGTPPASSYNPATPQWDYTPQPPAGSTGGPVGQPQQPQYAQQQYSQQQYSQQQYSQQQYSQQQVTQEPQPPAEAPKQVRRGRRSLFWPGFAAGFLLLSAVSCGVSAAALGLNQLTLDEIRGANGAQWTPVPVTPTAEMAATAPDAEAGAQPPSGSTRFAAGQAARNMTNSRVNIRMTPGYLRKGTGDVIGQLEAGQTLQILGEPTLADELTWWRVQAQSNGQPVVGWVAESTASGVQILGVAP